MSAKANIVHHNNVRSCLIKLLCKTRKAEDKPEILAAASLGIENMTDILQSRKSLLYLSNLCDTKALVGKLVLFQTKDDKEKRGPAFWAKAQLTMRSIILDPQ
jgi:hypothetical protein